MGLSHANEGVGPVAGKKLLDALSSLPENATELRTIEWLRTRLAPAEARLAAELVRLRRRAVAEYGESWLAYWTRKGYEQATAPAVARARARRVLRLRGPCSVLDACAGLGSDSLALAKAGTFVVSADRDFSVAKLCALNLEAAGQAALVLQMDACQPAARAEVLLLDPDRRPAGKRTLDPARWSPSLAQCLAQSTRFPAAVLKLAPSLDPATFAGLPRAFPQWVSRRGALAELCLWMGELAPEEAGTRAVLLLKGDHEEHWQARPEHCAPHAPERLRELRWLADPDPALVCSGLLEAYALERGLAPIAARSAYLAGMEEPESPFLAVRRILDQSPLDPRRVRAMLGKYDIGPVSVRKRGHPLPAEELARRFSGPGSQRGEIAVARLERGHIAFLLSPPQRPGKAMVGDEGFEPPTSSL